MRKGMSSHQHPVMKSDEWLSPPEIIKSLGVFDLDPCAPVNRPWPTAVKHYTIIDNGLLLPWHGRVWLNPPYSRQITAWLKKMQEHNNGIALTFGRLDTAFFHDFIFATATSLFAFRGRLNFYTVAGTRAKLNAGAPSVLIAYGLHNSEAIEQAGFKGKHIPLVPQMVIIGISSTWKSVISIAFNRLNKTTTLQQLYEIVEIIAPDKCRKNQFFKEKVRQTVNRYFIRIEKGLYTNSTIKID